MINLIQIDNQHDATFKLYFNMAGCHHFQQQQTRRSRKECVRNLFHVSHALPAKQIE